MIIPPLKSNMSWRGTFYPKGCMEVPDQLARALGHSSDDYSGESAPKSMRVIDVINDSQTFHGVDSLPGIGQVYGQKIIDRKPTTGYKDFQHFQSINSDLRIDWEALKFWSQDE